MYRKIISYISLSILILLCFITLMLSTPWGSHLTVVLINKTTPLTASYQGGIFIKSIELSNFFLDGKELSVNANSLVLTLNPRCLLQKKLCIEELSIQSLSVNVKKQTEPEQYSDGSDHNDLEKFVFPFLIQANKFYVKKFRMIVNDMTVTSENINTKLLFDNSTIALYKPDITMLSLTLTDNKTLKNNVTNNTQWGLASLPVIPLPVELRIEKAKLKKFVFQPTNGLPQQQLDQSQFTLSWQETELSIKHFATEHTVYGGVLLHGKTNFIPPYKVNITASSELNNIDFFSIFDGTQQRLQLSGDLSALTFNSQLTGNIELVAKGQVDLTKKELPFTSRISINKHLEWERLLSASNPINASVTVNGDVNNQQFVINGLISAYGYNNAELILDASHYGSNLIINKFSFNEQDTQSKLSLQGQLNYSDALSWDAKLTSSGFTLPIIQSKYDDINGRFLGNIDISGKSNVDQWSIKIRESALQGVINDTPISAVGNVALGYVREDEQWQLMYSRFLLTAGEAKLEMTGYTDENWHVSGALSIPTLAQFITDSRGELSSTFLIEGTIKEPVLQFNNHIRHLYWHDISSPDIKFDGNYQPLQSHKMDFSILSNKIYWQGLPLSSLIGQLKGDINQQSISIKWLGDLAANLSLSSKWLEETKQWQSKLIDSDISYKGKQWQPDKSIDINYHQMTHSLWIAKHCWYGKSIKLCSDKDITVAKSGEIDLLADIELKEVGDLLLPNDIIISTKLHNKISLKWQSEKPLDWSVLTTISQGNIKLLKAKSLNEQPLILAWEKGNASFHLNNDILTSHFLITPKSHKRSDVKQALVDINTKIDFANNNHLSGNILIDDLSLFFLQPYLSETSQLNGSLRSNINISGSLSSPNFYGNMAINNTEVSFVRSANKLDKLTLNLELLGKKAKLGGQGLVNNDIVNITGNLDWQEQFNASFNLKADHLSLSHPPHISAVVAPNIDVTFNKQLLSVSGEIDIKQGNVTINKLPKGSVSLSNDVVIVNDNDEEIEQTSRFAITTDLKLNIADNVNISGYGFNGLLGGKLLVKQLSHQDVQLFGNLNVVNGLYRAYGQRLVVENGRVSFNGPVDNPLIDLRAVRNLPKENITAGIEIYGPAQTLSVNLFSTPTKSNSEILSYIVRGQGIDTKAKSNDSLGITLGATLANSSGVLEQIEKLPFINNLEIEGDDQQASIAGYVGKNIYLKYGFGIAEPINELTVRFYLLNRLWIEVVSGLEQSTDLYFSFDDD